MVEIKPDLKKPPRIRDALLMKQMHRRGVICVLCGQPATLHHIYPRGQGGDDVEANFVGLCGDGTSGHHGLIEDRDIDTRADLGEYIGMEREDTINYLVGKLGAEEAKEWLRRRFFIDV